MAQTIVVPDLMCGNCAAAIKQALGQLAGVSGVEVDLATKAVTIEGSAPRAELVGAIERAGYKPVA